MSGAEDVQIISVCENCGERVVDGPQGGYCCSRCGHSVDPPDVVRARRQADWDRRRAAREGSWPELRRLIRRPSR
ncbi:hypothetical protein GXW83_16885 [Streptacidiphilus sp. PB12-B1b]|uniref:hypothetical protein n=1 Tax=Streptacidiphilus sp. PB12-B1b TaxID=2705012 RepID=UPI0015FC328B|nr:hypothetical protein [Streptacidiphilus sp. PB12-B1b]QMU77135.1 hypothetical protein GXW83_16885 [Streptacidiphilus sp. PB12-B1b]